MQSLVSNLPSFTLGYAVTSEISDKPPNCETENFNELLVFIKFDRNELEQKFKKYWTSHNGILEFIFYTPLTRRKALEQDPNELDTSNHKGKYIAVRGNKILGWGDSPQQAYEMAKKVDPESNPALTYVPESEDVIYFVAAYFY